MAMNPVSRDYASTATGSQDPVGVDWRDTPSGFAYQIVFNAGASGSVTIDTTLDNLNAIPAITPVWVASSAITSTTSGFIGSPVQFVRITIGSLSGGTLTFKLLEGAPDGGGDSSGVGGGAAQAVSVVGGSVGLLGGTSAIGSVYTTPSANANAGIVPVKTATAASSVILKNTAGNLYGFNADSGISAGYVLVFDSATVPANGTVTPIKAYNLAATSSVEVGYSPPIRCANGCVLAYSTTGPFTLTLSATAFLSGDMA